MITTSAIKNIESVTSCLCGHTVLIVLVRPLHNKKFNLSIVFTLPSSCSYIIAQNISDVKVSTLYVGKLKLKDQIIHNFK